MATDEDTTQNNDKFPPYRPLDEPELQRQFVGPVRRLAATADVAVPSLGVHPSSTPLCYTVHDQGETVLIASRGLFETLPDRELEAVLAHEVAHLSNGDHRLLSLVTAPLVLVEQLSGPPVDGTKPDSDYDHWSDVLYMVLVAVGSACTVVLFMALLSRFGGYVALLVTALAFIVAVTAFTYAYRAALGWATLGTGLFSRGRELAADRGAAALTGDPGALAAALQRLHEADYERPSTDLRDLAHTHDALNVVPTLDPGRDVGGILGTHPPTDERIERLRELEAAFETA